MADVQIAETVVRNFQTEGVVVLRGVFADWVETLRAGAEEVMRNPSALERTYRPQDGSAPFFQDFCNWQRIAEFRSFVFESPAASIAAQLMRSRTVRFFHDHLLVKHPGTTTVTPWHHDQPYYCVAGPNSVSFWTPLDLIARAESLECVAGSHRWSTAGYRPTRFDGSALYPADAFDEVPDIEAQRQHLTVRGWDMAPGDAVAFDFRTLHRAPGNPVLRERRVFSSRWVGDGARFVRRGVKGSPPFPHLDIRDGAPFDAPEFPLIYG
jgi:ectoine hydroxylase-related dioxygenase (phytanoyl-CoA dioxygenase family)